MKRVREREREGERMNGRAGLRTVTVSRRVIETGLYVHWAHKQVVEDIMPMNEEEGTLSLSSFPLPLFLSPPLCVCICLTGHR